MTWEDIAGFNTHTITPFYARMVAKYPAGSRFVEIGNWLGRSLCFLGAEVKKSGKAIKVYGVDTGHGSAATLHHHSVKEKYGGTMAGHLAKHIRECKVGDIVTQIVCPSLRAAELFPDASLDLVFIDADHRRDAVIADIKAWFPKLRPGGTIGGHDYGRSDVTGVVHEMFPLALIEADVWSVEIARS